MNMNENPFSKIQILLSELSLHINRINEIILQMNLVLNEMNYPINNQFNIQMNEMNKFMDMMNVNQMNFNNNMDNSFKIKKNKFMHNVTFVESTGIKYLIPIEEDKTINELLNEYCRKSNKFDLVDNYDDYINFIHNASVINKQKNQQIKELFQRRSPNKIDLIFKKK